ncbi:hypothetical protein EKQ61_01450 [Staphylococcus gallinarum]|uniref:Phage protein n=1 Tax=Staphylococcus gallinarum TaxID=1293 RepID=A0ABQ0XYU1_STAGA|nr:SA1788 family PVL leukocidin-associated protein [Staphylococcus gallinarum]KIR10656.1 hypothetical protein SH09_10830 [Staphylococcus gallinarum]RTX82859.1 hypothetical protein EKQ61_01450 [Staphylococcus gallinarum]GEQ04543.1 hypothetical protein SGA02_03710 [Staphylococcus gallinarum]
METMSIRGKVYEIPDTYLEQANLNGVSWQRIYQRLVRNKGWTIKEACFAPEGMKLGEYRQIVRMKEREEREKNAYSNLLEEKLINERPWLYDGTPQPPYKCSLYVCKQMKYDVFPKVKTDAFGHVQLI